MNLKNTLNRLKISADWLSLRDVENQNRMLFVRDEKLEHNKQQTDRGVMVEVLCGGQFAYAASNDCSFEAIQCAADRATTLAKATAKWNLYKFSEEQRPKATGEFHSPVQQTFDKTSLRELTDILVESTRKLKVTDQVINRVSYGVLSDTTIRFISTNGSDFTQTFQQNYYDQSVTAQKNAEVQTRSSGMRVAQAGFEFFSREGMHSEAERIGHEVLELLDAENCPTEILDVILSPDQLYLQIHESIGHPLELDRILGDERNYAGWSFVNPEDFGKLKYGSKLLNVTFDPGLPGELASYAFDDIGHEAKKEFIIKDGILVRSLGGLESQVRSNIPGVACARATGWNRPPVDRMANLNIEPGISTLNDMISSIEKGVLMHTNKSWSIDDYRNKFQFGCEYGKLIENGKITKTVKNPNYRGMCTPFWNNLKMVGNKDTFEVWGSFYCGKAEPNQIVRVGHATPTCLFENIEVFGGVQ